MNAALEDGYEEGEYIVSDRAHDKVITHTFFQVAVGKEVQAGNKKKFIKCLTVKRYWKQAELLQKDQVGCSHGSRIGVLLGGAPGSQLSHDTSFLRKLKKS